MRKEAEMVIVGCAGLPARSPFVDGENNDLKTDRLGHRDDTGRFFGKLSERGLQVQVSVSMEANGTRAASACSAQYDRRTQIFVAQSGNVSFSD